MAAGTTLWGNARASVSACRIEREKPQSICLFFFQAEDGIRARDVTGVQTCALPILNLLAVDFRQQLSCEPLARFNAQLAMIQHIRTLDLYFAIFSLGNDLTNLRVVSNLRDFVSKNSRLISFRARVPVAEFFVSC